MIRNPSILSATALCALAAMSAAWADGPVAIVEDVGPSTRGVELMQVLSVGEVIRLKASDTVRIGYFETCAVETISGGEVTIGEGGSTVVGGSLQREQATCDVGRFKTTGAQAQLAGAATFRKPATSGRQNASPQPTVVLYGTSPVVSVASAADLTISAVGADATSVAVRLPRGTHDLNAHGVKLVPGEVYTASIGNRTVAFKISAAAEDGNIPVISRFLPL